MHKILSKDYVGLCIYCVALCYQSLKKQGTILPVVFFQSFLSRFPYLKMHIGLAPSLLEVNHHRIMNIYYILSISLRVKYLSM